MKKNNQVILKLGEVDINGNVYSESISFTNNSKEPIPVNIDFDEKNIVGNATNLRVEDKKVLVDIEVEEGKEEQIKKYIEEGLIFRPGFNVEEESVVEDNEEDKNVRVFDKINVKMIAVLDYLDDCFKDTDTDDEDVDEDDDDKDEDDVDEDEDDVDEDEDDDDTDEDDDDGEKDEDDE